MFAIAQSLIDDLIKVEREIVEKLGEMLNPDKKRRKPAPVPVPVRRNPNYPPVKFNSSSK